MLITITTVFLTIPLAAVGFAANFAASIFNDVGVGPNRADEEEDNLDEEKDEVRK
jgi:formate dehydrogenase iron-sulfur subunit